MNNSVAIIIPARYASKRFPGKPLAKINDKSLIHHTILAGLKASDHIENTIGVFVATDDERIADHVRSLKLDAKVLMTSESCENGTERTAEAYQELVKMGHNPGILVNLQGDSLLTPARFIKALVEEMRDHPDVMISTPALQCDSETLKNFQDDAAKGLVGGTTMTFTSAGDALYFSKSIIPYVDPTHAFSSDADIPVYHHVGLYAYRPKALATYCSLPVGPCETYEKLEQLRFLENGHAVRTVTVQANGEVFWEVNNPEDIDRVSPHL